MLGAQQINKEEVISTLQTRICHRWFDCELNKLIKCSQTHWMLIVNRREFFSSICMTNRVENFEWEVVNVCGRVQIERKENLLNGPVHRFCNRCLGSWIIRR